MQIAERIKRAREDLGLSQSALAEAVGVDLTSVWRWEHGRASPARFIRKLADVLGVTPAYLLDGAEAPAAPSSSAVDTAEQVLTLKQNGYQVQLPATPEGYQLYREIIGALLSGGQLGGEKKA